MKNTISAYKFFSVPTGDVQGSAADERTHIYERRDTYIMVRKTHIQGLKPGEPIDICHISDLHFDYLNAEDFADANPAIMSSAQGRKWQRGAKSVGNALKALDYATYCDQLVITGDILDYFTKGALECTKRMIWDRYPDAICSLGGHDVTCKMQGQVADTIPLEKKYEMLQAIWNHDLQYYSRIIGNRAMVIQMNNDCGKYTADQLEQLRADLRRAREEQLVVLIFQHEPMVTGNPNDTEVEFIRVNDANGCHDFYHLGVGAVGCSPVCAEVYEAITTHADVVKGLFCGHRHSDIYTEILATYPGEDGKPVDTVIPQYVLTANCYDAGHVLHIVID